VKNGWWDVVKVDWFNKGRKKIPAAFTLPGFQDLPFTIPRQPIMKKQAGPKDADF